MIKIISPIFNDIMLVYIENWQLKYKDEYLDLDVGIFEALMSLFPFLEQKKSFYIGMIDSNDIEAINGFPVKEIIEAGFVHDISYWVKLAVEWLDNENNDDLNIYFSTYLNKIVNNKAYEQKTRQIVEKILNYSLQNLDN